MHRRNWDQIPQQAQSGARGGARRRRVRAASVAIAVVVTAISAMTALAVARTQTLGSATARLSGPSGKRSEAIAVNSHGVAVYELLPETTRHVLCTSAGGCLKAWPPVKVSSAVHLTKPGAIRGRLGRFHRGGFTQLTLNGHPLYTFVEDGGRRGIATGDGLHGFGGVWRVVRSARAHRAGASGHAGSSGW